MSPKDEYFDWVSERKKCSLQYKFEELKIHAEKNAATAGFEYQTNGEFFVLSRSGKRARSVTFNLDLTKDHVLVKRVYADSRSSAWSRASILLLTKTFQALRSISILQKIMF